ncbi:MAG: transpeptidase family protein [Candidatus Hydrogenedentes bacterium]|nr:transpeptidase family protein [Candidatus Hydrogenedentota bacterium]
MAHRDRNGDGPRHAELPLTQSQRWRIRLVLWGMLAGLLIVALHLVRLQLFPDHRFLDAEGFHVGEAPIPLQRGRIYDREGRIFARERQAPSLFAYPPFLERPHEAAQSLAVRLGLDENDLIDRITRRASGGKMMQEVAIKRSLTPGELESIGNLNAWGEGGLRIKYEPARHYPEGQLAAHVLGFVDRDQNGLEGIEAKYDTYLKAIPGKQTSRVDGKRSMLMPLTLEYVAPEGGADIFLTIDKPIQHILEQQLDFVIEDKLATSAMGIVMDPTTGAILAMATRPAFDPNAPGDYPAQSRVNAAISFVFEPGSAFKIVPLTAAIEHGLVTPADMIDCEGGAWNAFGLRRIRDVHKMGTVTLAEMFAQSSNIGTIKVAHRIVEAHKAEMLDAWIRKFGFGVKTGRDFRHESAGFYHPDGRWTKYSEISLPMGQEIAVTMPQLARAFAAIANGGYLVEPHLVDHVVDHDGQIAYQFEPGGPDRIMSAQTAMTMRDLCYGVVEHGTGKRAAIPEYRVGGKTGTAQVARPKSEGGGYYPDRHTAVFAGFGPVADPRLVAVIVVCNPKSDIYYGGFVCGPVFKEVVRESLIRLECPEDPMPPGTYTETKEENDADVLVAQAAPAIPGMLDINPLQDIGEGAELASANTDQPIGPGQLPSLIGLTKRQVKDKLAVLGVEWDAQGSGWVVSQDPAAGTAIQEVPLCRLVFSNTRNATPAEPAKSGPASKLSALDTKTAAR